MRAIILAAGKGSRLKGVAGDKPKCLARVGELTLIERQISSLRASGIDDIVAVVGFGAESVRSVCGPDIEYVENFSVWMDLKILLRTIPSVFKGVGAA